MKEDAVNRLTLFIPLVISLGLCGCENPCDKLSSFKCDPDNPEKLMQCIKDEKIIASECVKYMKKHESKLNSMCEDKGLSKLKPCLEHNHKVFDEKVNEFSKTSEFHAMVCTEGSNLIAYHATLSNELKPILRLIFQITSDSDGKSYFSVGELKKGSEVEKENLMGEKYLGFDGTEIRTLSKYAFNIMTKKSSEFMIEAYKGEKVRFLMDIPYEAASSFDIKAYEYCSGLFTCLRVSSTWNCKTVTNEEYTSLTNF